MQVSKELIHFFDDPLSVSVARDKRLLTLQTLKATRLTINKAKNYEGVLVRCTCFRVLFYKLTNFKSNAYTKEGAHSRKYINFTFVKLNL